ncbi:serine/threonine protein kinase [Nodosilinea sp. LEGE 07088]|uniref:serine/threonine protein kinase n=1 Tax=Nodosilinea sp. LEGE 07088 TaxID=2777968 RepID=UPI0018808AEB|nr:serine/threonine-protein kinase [Nodosilinea sp. LEGE 07088]MBE9141023.1 serine/threonine protein kinase [Nodosilinea sp. LEGE 07088]
MRSPVASGGIVSYCINPKCPQRQQPDGLEQCAACGTDLVVGDRYRLLRPLRELDDWSAADIFEVADRDAFKVMKVLKQPKLRPPFEREAQTLQRLHHPGIPEIEPDGYFIVTTATGQSLACLVMEKIEGLTLEQWLDKHGPADQTQVQAWLRQACEILGLVHQSELFHRDIKLSNLMLRPNGQLALIDFGTVRQMSNTYLAKVGGQREVTSIVSPGYTPLEQINGKAVPQSDFYALGRSLVHLLTGQHPVDLETDEATGALIWRESAPQVDRWFAELIDDLMAPFPGQRPLNAQEIVRRLDAKPVKPSSNPDQIWVQALIGFNIALLLLHGLLGWRWVQTRSEPPRSPSIEQL